METGHGGRRRLTALESGGDSPTCLEVWRPLGAMAQPGTWTLSVWVDAAERLQLSPERAE